MENIKTHCLIVNYKNLKDLKNLVNDVLKQDVNLLLTIVDQNSEMPELDSYYNTLKKYEHIKIVKNVENKPLNHVWNWFAENNNEEFLAFLNNDIRIPSNFVSDSEKIFNEAENIGITIHVTNNLKYVKKTKLNYLTLQQGWQGWDFTVRNKWYDKIPTELKWFGGDAHIFEGILYKLKKDLAFIFSSPIIHHQGLTKTPERTINSKIDSQTRRDMNAPTPPRDQIMVYTNIKPTVETIKQWETNNN